MTQPRKEQVKNLKTKYSKGPASVTFGGAAVQVLSGVDYTNVLGALKTGVDGGAEVSSGAVLTGAQGPFNLSANSSFTIILPGVNGGSPMSVLFLLTDFITLDAQSVITTSRTAAKINGVVAGFGVTTPIAFNVDGRLVLRSANTTGPTFGDEAFISLSDVTPGTLQVFGLSLVNQASAAGTTAPKRGLITSAQDGLGGFLQIRDLDTVPTEPLNTAMLHMGDYRYVPEVLPGRPAYGRVRKNPVGSGLEIRYFRVGPAKPSLVTKSSNFTAIELTDTIQIGVNFGLPDGTFTFTVSVEDMVTVQQVIDEINDQFRVAWGGSNPPPTQAMVLIPVPGPFVFSNPASHDSFFISFNGNAPIHINPPAGPYSASSFCDYINARIAAAGQTAEGSASFEAFDSEQPRVKIASSDLGGFLSSVQFLPGNPGGTVPGTYMETLNALGVVPGVYRGTHVAELYGLDEIRFLCPSALPGASLTVTPLNPGAAALWGVPVGATTVAVSTGPMEVSVPIVEVILPEMVEFHEERDNYDTEMQDFLDRGDVANIDPTLGVGNVGISALLGQTGKIDPSFIPRILETLGLNQLTLGSKLLKNDTDQKTPRAVYPHDPAIGGILLWEGVSVQGLTNGIVRMYLNGTDVYLTRNAKQGAMSTWSRDAAGDSAMFEFRAGKGAFASWPAANATTWNHTDWLRDIRFNPFAAGDGPYGDGILSLGEFKTSGGTELKPRVQTPILLETQTLLFSANAATGMLVRVYVGVDALGQKSFFEITVNAVWNGAQYNKDVTGKEAARYKFSNFAGFEASSRHAANDTAWAAWDNNVIRADPASLITFLGGQMRPGWELQDGSTPRISVTRFNPGSVRRTLLFESPISGALASIPIRVYIDTSNTAWTGWPTPDPGDGFMFTYNARWDQTLDKWVQDVPTNRSYAYGFLDQRLWLLSKVSGSAPWGDGWTPWDRYCLFELPGPGGEVYSGVGVKDGIFRVDGASTTSNPVNTAGILLNAVYAKSMLKSWGRGRYQTANTVVYEGFNFSSIGVNAFAWDAFYATGINGNACTLATFEQSDTNFAIGGPAFVSEVKIMFPLGNRHIVYLINLAGGNMDHALYAAINHVVFCAN